MNTPLRRFLALLCPIFTTVAFSTPTPEPTAPPPVIVVIGDSLIAHGDWAQGVGRADLINWGIPGYTTGQLAWTFKDVLAKHPGVKACLLEGGINDLTLGVPAERVYANQIEAIRYWRDHQVVPVLQAIVLQRGNTERNVIIREINRRLLEYCLAHQVDFIDPNLFLCDADGPRADYTTDGTHLRPAGYLPWYEAVKSYLQKHNL